MWVYADEIIPKYTHVADDVLAQQAGKLGVYAVFAYTIYPSHPLYILIFPSVGTPCCKVYAWSILDATKMPPGNWLRSHRHGHLNSCCFSSHLSSVQNPYWLMIIGDYTTQHIGDYNHPIGEFDSIGNTIAISTSHCCSEIHLPSQSPSMIQDHCIFPWGCKFEIFHSPVRAS